MCITVSPLQVCCGGPPLRPLETWVQPVSASPCGQDAARASRSIPSRLTAFPTCYFPLLLSVPGRLGDPRTSLRVLPASGRLTRQRLMAHPFRSSEPLSRLQAGVSCRDLDHQQCLVMSAPITRRHSVLPTADCQKMPCAGRLFMHVYTECRHCVIDV